MNKFKQGLYGAVLVLTLHGGWATSALAEDGITDNSILVGQSAALTGPGASLGLEMKQGIEALFSSVNKEGGVNGRKLKLIALDDAFDPGKAEDNTRKLIKQEKVFALLGYVGTGPSKAAMPVFIAAKVPFIGAYSGTEALRTPFNRLVFNVRASYIEEAGPIIRSLKASGSSKIAIFYQNDAFGQETKLAIEKALAATGDKLVAVATADRAPQSITWAADAILKSGADAVVLGCDLVTCSEFIAKVRDRGTWMAFAVFSTIGSNGLMDKFGDDARGIVIPQVMPAPFSASIPLIHDYRKAMKDAGYEKFSYGSLEGYFAARVFVEGVRRAGRPLTRDKLISSLESMNSTEIGRLPVSFSPNNHNGSHLVEITVVAKGKTLLR